MKSASIFVSSCALAGFILLPITAQQFPQNDAVGYEQGQAPDQADPEDRTHGVARISLLNGDVSVRRGDSGDSVAAALNAPLLAQDSLVTGPSSRSEIQFDTANRVRFGFDTEIRVAILTADNFQVQIAHGTLTWAVLGQSSIQGEIATPSVAMRPLGPGSYRVAVLPDGTTQITVRAGTLEVATQRGAERISAGQTMLARGSVENPEFQTIAAVARDEWDVFNERRDRELQQSQSYNYVSRDIAGAEDLDNYGQWNQDPAYGQVWTPRVADDWAPYRLGRWGYEDYYGWTWISADPWGWAPYHYGNWFHGNRGWSWYPGTRYSRHYYRPALVAFFGFGGGSGFGLNRGWGFGNVGWVPLAPYERYNRWYGRGFNGRYNGFGRNGTIVNNTNITNVYRNARTNNGVTSVNSRDFESGHFGRYSSPSGNQLQQAGMVRGQVPFSPTNNHLRFNDRQTGVQGRTDFNQTRFSTGRAFSGASSGAVQGSSRQFAQPQGPRSGSTWDRFGTPGSPAQSQQSGGFGRSQSFGQQPGGNSSNWPRFGEPSATRQNSTSNFGRANGNVYRQQDVQRQQFGRGGSQSLQVAPPVVRERFSQPNFNSQHESNSNRGFNQQPHNSQSRDSGRQSSGQPGFGRQQQSSPRQDPGRAASGNRGFGNHEGGSHRR